MITIFAFIIVLFGSLNWLSIGMFQYDIVAGLFGFQGNIFSRIIYIIIGVSALWLTYAVIRYKGKLTIKKSLKNEPMPNNQNQQNSNQPTQPTQPTQQTQQTQNNFEQKPQNAEQSNLNTQTQEQNNSNTQNLNS